MNFVCAQNQKMKLYIDWLGNLGVEFPKDLAIYMVLNFHSSSYCQFVMNYNMNNLNRTIMDLHGMLKTAGACLVKAISSNPNFIVLDIRCGRANLEKKFSHCKGKAKVRSSNKGIKIKKIMR